MRIPSFAEFASTLTEDQITGWVGEISQTNKSKIELERVNGVINLDVTPIASTNLLLSMKMLEAYHKWISNIFEDQL